MFADNTNTLRMTNSDVNQHSGIITVLTVHENENYPSSFENVIDSQINSTDVDASLFHVVGPITQMYHPYIGFLSSTFSDNFGTLFGQSLTNTDASTMSGDIWSDSGIFEFENTLFLRNNISKIHSYLLEFEYHEMRMNNIQFNENICHNKK